MNEVDATFQITVDCADPDAMARFWAEALRYQLHEPPDGHASWREYWLSLGVPDDEAGDGYDAIVDPTGQRPRVWFQQVPEGKTIKNRLHLDLLVGGGRAVPFEERQRRVEAEADRLAELGAIQRNLMNSPNQGHFAIGMLDPEGNEFDIV